MLKNLVTYVAAIAAFAFCVVSYGQQDNYDQPYRPQVHFSPQKNWTNDPNGLVYYQGEYHLFYQYNPFGDQWGHMSWGHAVSTDLLHWKELPVAIPEENGVMIFTGSVVIDHRNTSGLCGPGKECMVAVYTGYSQPASGALQNQNLAYSLDNGRTWSKYKANPVLDLHLADFRDPSVSWDDALGQWLMVVSLPKEHKVQFYASPDLKTWKHMSDFGPAGDTAGDWECPDLLRIPSQDGKQNIWALKVGLNPGGLQGGSGEQYFLGGFDGKSFTHSAEAGAQGWTNYGKDDYCAISFNGLPPGQKPVLLGWMSNWQYAAKQPTSPWRGQMSLPRRLTFVRDADGLALIQKPESASLRGAKQNISAAALQEAGYKMKAPYEVEMKFDPSPGETAGIKLYSDSNHWTELGFDQKKMEFYMDRTHAGAEISADFPARTAAPMVKGRPLNLRLVVDRSSVEAYAQDGTIAMTNLLFPASISNTIKNLSNGQTATGYAWTLKSIWKPGPP